LAAALQPAVNHSAPVMTAFIAQVSTAIFQRLSSEEIGVAERHHSAA